MADTYHAKIPELSHLYPDQSYFSQLTSLSSKVKYEPTHPYRIIPVLHNPVSRHLTISHDYAFMNLLLLEDKDFVSEGIAEISGRRYEHIVNILKPDPGGTIKTGLIDGNTGTATVLAIDKTKLRLKVDLFNEPEPPLPVTLLLALPRPKMLKRILQICATLGVSRLYLINSYRVEKSYWQSPWLETKAIDGQLRLGLEQAGTTALPQVELRKRFKPFVEDELDTVAGKTTRLLAHPSRHHPHKHQPAPVSLNQPSTLAVGPEGGFIDYEIDKLVERSFTPVSLGKRILKVETAVTALLSRLYT